MQHVSIRVPWHDSAWDGTVCRHPDQNGDCLVLDQIHENRDDAREAALAGRSWDGLSEKQFPACVVERGGFMAPFVLSQTRAHPYEIWSPAHKGIFLPTSRQLSPYSADCLPFRWMRRDSAEEVAQQYNVAYSTDLELRADRLMYEDEVHHTKWVQDRANQLALLDTFFSAIQPEKSLCFFYAKRVPLTEEAGRVLIGVGRVLSVAPAREYDYIDGKPGELRSILWERSIQHSIRPGFKDGFIFPYHQILALADADPGINPADYVALAPQGHFVEFSYASEHIHHDTAIEALLICAERLRRVRSVLPDDWDGPLAWIDERLNEIWRMRGPCPGLGSALTAFGVEQGTFLAYEIASRVGENEDPWPLVEQLLTGGSAPQLGHAQYVTPTLCKKWQALPAERRALLRLISRFDLNAEQAARFYMQEVREKEKIEASDAALLANPYLLHELDRFAVDRIELATVDRGVFPDSVIRGAHPLAEPTRMDDPTDPRRVRGLIYDRLEKAAGEGHTLLSRTDLVNSIRESDLSPACPVDGDLMNVVESHFSPAINKVEMADGAPAYQLAYLTDACVLIRNVVERRLTGKPHAIEADWAELLAKKLPSLEEIAAQDRDEELPAREEKAAALRVLAESRFAVLVGQAGTGKTTLLSVLCEQPDVAAGGVLLLAPTGKARVQMQKNSKLQAQTIAQFLLPHRYAPESRIYHLSQAAPQPFGKTVIIDEASMVTEEQLAAVLQSLAGVERLILVGDPRQLPSIGAGRPFVDIITHLRRREPELLDRFPRVGKNYAELVVPRRFLPKDEGGHAHSGPRDDSDSVLAAWFSGEKVPAGGDEIWSRLRAGQETKRLKAIQWETPEQLREILLDELVADLELSGRDDEDGFELSLGGQRGGSGSIFFWRNKTGVNGDGAGAKAEAWQILSPVNGRGFGVEELNRVIQRQFRQKRRRQSQADVKPWQRRIPKPVGVDEIVYGDKVINTIN